MFKQKKKKKLMGELNFISLLNSTHCNVNYLQKNKQHPHKQQTTPTPQNRNPKNQKPPRTC
jgi:hypothetical protein